METITNLHQLQGNEMANADAVATTIIITRKWFQSARMWHYAIFKNDVFESGCGSVFHGADEKWHWNAHKGAFHRWDGIEETEELAKQACQEFIEKYVPLELRDET